LKVAYFRAGYAENRELPEIGWVAGAGSHAVKGMASLEDDLLPWRIRIFFGEFQCSSHFVLWGTLCCEHGAPHTCRLLRDRAGWENWSWQLGPAVLRRIQVEAQSRSTQLIIRNPAVVIGAVSRIHCSMRPGPRLLPG
jgi:hypothetical protein